MIRRFLQVVLVVIALIALTTGAMGLRDGMEGDFYLSGASSGKAVLDSNLRYFSGLWLGVGLILLWMVPSVERQRTLLVAVSIMVFLGGLGRVLSMARFGLPPALFVVFTGLELICPTLILLHRHLPRQDVLRR